MTDLVKGGIRTLFSQVLALALLFLTTIVLARVLGPSGHGKYGVIILVPTLLQLIGALGIPIAIVYYGARAEYSPSKLVATSLTISLLLGLGMVALFVLVSKSEVYQSLVRGRDLDPTLILMAVTTVPLYLIFQFMRQALRSQEKIDAYNIVNVFQIGMTLLSVWFMLTIIKSGLGGAVIGYLFGMFSAVILVSWFVSRLTPLRLGIDMDLAKNLSSFGLRSYVGNIFQFLNYRLDLLVIWFIAGVTEVGYYVAAVMLVERLWDLPDAIRVGLQPRITSVSNQEAVRLIAAFTRNTLTVIMILALIMAVFSKFFVHFLYGTDYTPTIIPLLLLLPGIVVFSITKFLATYLTARGHPEMPSISAAVALVINLSLNLLLIPHWGIAGAAVASTVTYIVVTILMLYYFISLVGGHIGEVLFIRRRDITAMYRVMANALAAHFVAALRR